MRDQDEEIQRRRFLHSSSIELRRKIKGRMEADDGRNWLALQ